MNVIRHEAVGENAEIRLAGGGAEQIEIDLAVGICEKDGLAVGSALRNVMGKPTAIARANLGIDNIVVGWRIFLFGT
jgi:hypothetical protein